MLIFSDLKVVRKGGFEPPRPCEAQAPEALAVRGRSWLLVCLRDTLKPHVVPRGRMVAENLSKFAQSQPLRSNDSRHAAQWKLPLC